MYLQSSENYYYLFENMPDYSSEYKNPGNLFTCAY